MVTQLFTRFLSFAYSEGKRFESRGYLLFLRMPSCLSYVSPWKYLEIGHDLIQYPSLLTINDLLISFDAIQLL